MPFLNNLSSTELLLIGLILIFLFGGKKMSQWARGLGQTGRELKSIKKEFTNALSDENEDEEIVPSVQKPKAPKMFKQENKPKGVD